MQRTIPMHGVDFEVEFDMAGEVDALYIGGTEVTEVIRDVTKWAIHSTVEHNAARWFAEYYSEMADADRENRRAA